MKTNQDILNMSDEDFLKLSPPVAEAAAAAEDEAAEESEAEQQENTPVAEETDPEDAAESTNEAEAEEEAEEEEEVDPAGDQEAPEAKASKEPAKEPEAKADPEPKVEQKSTIDHKAFYERVMAPFKANGKMIELQSPEEAIQLMQMGANYTRKMQDLQSTKKFVMMLENNGLLDENKLSFLIDLEKGDTEAVKKFLKDRKIDPIDVDVSTDSQYKGGQHRVTDQEVAFHSAIDELTSAEGGRETIQSLNQWDQASKAELVNRPQIMKAIHFQRQTKVNGISIYDRIANEVNRQQMLGVISANTPFVQAYQSIGDQMMAAGAFNEVTKPATPAQPAPAARVPVATRPAKTPAQVKADNQRVRAAAAPRTPARPATTAKNPLSLSDDEFMKQYGDKY